MLLRCLPLSLGSIRLRCGRRCHWNKFGSSELPCLPNASHQVLAQSDLPFWSRCHFKILVAISDIGTERISSSKSPCHPSPSLGSIRFTIQEQTWFEDFQDGHRGGHLGYWNVTVLAILKLYVVLMPPIKFQLFGRCRLKIFKMANMAAAILDIWTE